MEFAEYPVFAYGSLLNLRSFERTVGREYDVTRPVCFVPGWKRAWNTAMPNEGFYEETSAGRLIPARITYLNVRPSPQSMLNGVVYFVTGEELSLIDDREWTYDRIVVDCDGPVTKAYLYVSKPEWICEPGKPRSWVAVRKTYVDAVADGVDSLGSAFRAGYEASTDPVDPDSILYDTIDDDVFEI
ncbi:MAG TPA: gamma-glutamylcyclotransferase family protein [Bryobacteraceae bacterium]|jgi:hypothetical protein|nr:gamma-glutamylcyclotransferase family protein [Bryobacteraceae bacterium]